MIEFDSNNIDIEPPTNKPPLTVGSSLSGKLLKPQQHLLLFTADDWESFIQEWAQFQKSKYVRVVQLGGANDYGIDVAGFTSDQGFNGPWDNYQCKYYKGDPLAPNTAIPEIGKILWHAYREEITVPRKYYFFSPKDCGPALKKLLLNPNKLKEKLLSEWDNWCAKEITSTQAIQLNGDFLHFVDAVDFSIFQYKPSLEVIEEHRQTPYFVSRFGGGLPERPAPKTPPQDLAPVESRYIFQLYEAYTDKEKAGIDATNLSIFPKLQRHYDRQREAFFHAESLKGFARDSVPEGTFESLQTEIHFGVIEACESDHDDGFARLKAVTDKAGGLPLTANGLIQVTKQQDRLGICHQLANDDRLKWVPEND
tara:strand:- start:2934 stop:4034 length:1101 start_codon:yes stop_codon:yes gene_type:complete